MIFIEMGQTAFSPIPFRKYTRARKLTPKMLNELIEKIEVYQAEEIDGKRIQHLKIHYNCIGSIEIPNIDKLPENNVSVHASV